MIKTLKNKLTAANRVKSKNITLTVEEVQEIIVYITELQADLLNEKKQSATPKEDNVVTVSIKPSF